MLAMVELLFEHSSLSHSARTDGRDELDVQRYLTIFRRNQQNQLISLSFERIVLFATVHCGTSCDRSEKD
jgi:hypothetical protein